MERKAVSGIMLTLLLIDMLTLAFNIQSIKAEPRTWIVDDDGPADFHTIQEGINAASLGDTLYVYNGTYYESLVVNKTILLKGEDKNATIIEGSDVWDVIYVVSSFVLIENFTIKNSIVSNQLGIRLSDGTSGNVVKNNVIMTSSVGIYIHASSGNTISQNSIGFSRSSGIESHWSSNNRIEKNSLTNLSYIGIGVWGNPGSNNEVVSNIISKCGTGIVIGNLAEYNTFRDNSIELTTYRGIDMWSSNHNSFLENNIKNNEYGIWLERSLNSSIYHNNFVNNTHQTHDYSWDHPPTPSSINAWDDGYPNGGNYWSDYRGVDLYSGSYQNETASDGIGDTPYVIDANNTDNYPLMQPYHGPVRNLNTGQSHPTIQEAINNASEGDRIFALSGIYYEHVVVNKTVSLIGENRETTIIDGGETWRTVSVTASNVNISGFTIRNGLDGVYLEFNNRNSIADNVVTNNARHGIWLCDSNENTIIGNSVVSNGQVGIAIDHSARNILKENNMTANGYNFALLFSRYPMIITDFIQDVDISNTVNGRPLYYWVNQANRQVPSDAGYLAIVNSTNIAARGLNLTKNGQGVLFAYTTNSTVENVNASGNIDGIFLWGSNNNNIRNNVLDDGLDGITLESSDNNVLSDNRASSNNNAGIWCWHSSHNTLNYNTLCRNYYGIVLRIGSNSNLVRNNLAVNNTVGVQLEGCYTNKIEGNTLADSLEHGLVLTHADNNAIYHNNFVKNAKQVMLVESFNNSLDNGCEGNYWSDYNGTDLDDDGIGDTYLPHLNVDYYPLINPYWNPADINHDLEVDGKDIAIIAQAFGSYPNHPRWNPHADANQDSEIDGKDISIAAKNFGKSWT